MTHFFLVLCVTMGDCGCVMNTKGTNGRADSGAGFLTLCGEILVVLLIFATGFLLLAL